jgi:hypothetical protein
MEFVEDIPLVREYQVSSSLNLDCAWAATIQCPTDRLLDRCIGTSDADDMRGTLNPDTMEGRRGDDSMNGRNGNTNKMYGTMSEMQQI